MRLDMNLNDIYMKILSIVEIRRNEKIYSKKRREDEMITKKFEELSIRIRRNRIFSFYEI